MNSVQKIGVEDICKNSHVLTEKLIMVELDAHAFTWSLLHRAWPMASGFGDEVCAIEGTEDM